MSTRVLAEYVWIGGKGDDYRCKTRVLEEEPKSPADLPDWNYDGSSTGQADGHDSEVFIKPRALFRDPFRGAPHVLVLCDCYKPNGEPIRNNTRKHAAEVFEKYAEEKPWFGLEQEYTLFKDGAPVGWPKHSGRSFGGPCVQVGYPGPQGPYYCSAGADVNFGREVVEAHLLACLAAGVTLSGINAEVMPGQWEFQVGPVTGISAGDHLHMARYLLHRVGEKFGVVASFDPKPIPGDWNGAGCHTNFSTEKMRQDGGYPIILKAIEKLSKKHLEHMRVYGEGNERRMTGLHETSRWDQFSSGVANRGASIRIPRQSEAENKGYFEDRRPASNMDPYVVTAKLFQTVCEE